MKPLNSANIRTVTPDDVANGIQLGHLALDLLVELANHVVTLISNTPRAKNVKLLFEQNRIQQEIIERLVKDVEFLKTQIPNVV